MQTFLPYKSFEASARVLDRQRLGKQRVETLQIMNALSKGVGWLNHPATLMWKGYEGALIDYQEAICKEWLSRGYQDTCLEKTWDSYIYLVGSDAQKWNGAKPYWLGLKKFHSTHRGNLLRKNPEHYGQFGWKELPMEGYYWPTTPGNQKVRIFSGN